MVDSDIFCVRPGFVFWREGGATRFMDKVTLSSGSLNETAYRILECLDGKTTIAGIVQRINESFEHDPDQEDQVASEVEAFLTQSLQDGVVLRGPLRNHLQAYWGETEKSEGFGFALPKLLYWEVTASCDLHCCFCYNNCTSACRGTELNIEQGVALIDRFSKEGIRSVVFTGGEPTSTFEKLAAWIRSCTEHGIVTELFTNGQHLTLEKIKELYNAGLGYCRVSIHSDDPAEHDRVVGKKGAFERALESLSLMARNNLPAAWMMSVGSHNVNRLRSIVERAIEIGCHGFIAGPVCAIGREKQHRKEVLSPQQYLQLIRFFDESRVVYGDRIKLGWGADVNTNKAWSQFVTAPIWPEFKDDKDFFLWYMRFSKNSICGTGVRSLGLDAQGHYIPCPSLNGLLLGSALDKSLAEVWHDERLSVFRHRSLDEFDECGHCGMRYACSGGCRANAFPCDQ